MNNNIAEFIVQLKKLDIDLQIHKENLRINAPKGILTPDLQVELSNRKGEILDFFRTIEYSQKFVALPVKKTERSERIRVSFAQQRLWFLHQLEPDSHAYNITFSYRLQGPLDVSVFERSLNEIVKRHEALRTTFVSVNGEPTQVIAASADTTLSVIDIQELSEREKRKKVHSVVSEESGHNFDLTKGPVLRATLLKADVTEHFFIFVVHHIAFDGWSAGVFLRELGVLYTAFSAGAALAAF